MARAGVGKKVAVFGGGIAGLTAAHELAERGFEVTVYERRSLGGKARSLPVPGSGTGGRLDLPAEHGFRIFAGYCQNTFDTMRRIPFPGNPDGAGQRESLPELPHLIHQVDEGMCSAG